MSQYNKELRLAISLVKKATEVTEWFRRKGFNSYLKGDQSPVTLADFASQIYIISKLKSHYSDDKIIAEEENVSFIDNNAENLIKQCFKEINFSNLNNLKENIGYRGKSSKRQWTVDPIDGTIGFQKGLSYAIGIGFMVKSIPKVCAIAVPNYKGKDLAIFFAEQGQGAQFSYNNFGIKSIKVSQTEDLKDVRLCHSLHYDQPWVLKFARNIGISNFIQIDSMAKLCMVADGSADLYIKPLELQLSKSWDFLPGDLLVREAGGNVTDLNGVRLRFKEHKCLWTGPGIIASNGVLQSKILELFKRESI
jgi:3'-phosphoadenosine 5'-phosphosulfate (PAPS) 3'-phosphatase